MRHRLWTRLAALTVLGGVVVVFLGVFMATVWAPARTVTTTLSPGDAPLVVTSPGFLTLNAPEVAVAARTSPGSRLFLGMARTADVKSYVADAPHRSVIGLTAQSDPITTEATGAGNAPPPGGVDIWVERVVGEGSASLTWRERPGAWSLVVASNGKAPAADLVTFTWALPQKRSAAPPVIAFGVLLIVTGAIGLALFLAPARMDFAPDDPPVPVPDEPVPDEPVQPWMERTP